MNKLNVCIIFGGISPEHEVSLRSAEAVLNNMNAEKYNIIPVGITKAGEWILFGGQDYGMLPTGEWINHPDNCKVSMSPVRGQGLLRIDGQSVETVNIDVVFPVLHGENGEDGSIQGLMQLAGIPCVGPGVAVSAVAMDKTLTKLVMDHVGIPQASWQLVRKSELSACMEKVLDRVEENFAYPVFVRREDLHGIAADAEFAARKAHVVAIVLDVHEMANELVAGDRHPRAERRNLRLVFLGRAEGVDARNARHDDHVAPFKQCARRAVA